MQNNPELKKPWCPHLALLTALLVASFISTHVEAAQADLSGINVGELGIVQSQTILFNAQAERAKAERAAGSGAASSNPVSSYPAQIPASPPMSADQPPRQQDLPVIKAITGSSNKLRATLLYSSGIEVEVTAGSRDLPGDFRVAQITLEAVVLERSGKRFLLGFSERAPSSVSYLPASTPPAIPGLAPAEH
ncbi:hypothetical protein BVH03_17720 [Pseudomonas sp. PA15(2017)]|uniref:type IV pilus biogenesis protein PilP n=1 Tax=Pseudomonas sp. PA15(2017) TaxID=1932111 RepID=UPI00095A900D|nr:type IV pilus biogenesis protein PilP [Pseudomonas sp. PA15(2017)]OLU25492.1 hypothetical protein BVH03_17720 [Pseudomonas sp. PA15(2017)]